MSHRYREELRRARRARRRSVHRVHRRPRRARPPARDERVREPAPQGGRPRTAGLRQDDAPVATGPRAWSVWRAARSGSGSSARSTRTPRTSPPRSGGSSSTRASPRSSRGRPQGSRGRAGATGPGRSAGFELGKDVTCRALSLGSVHAGPRLDLLLADDPVGLQENATPAGRAKALDTLLEVVLPMLVPDGRVLVSGTRWHEDDLYAQLIARGWRALVRRAIEDGRSLWPDLVQPRGARRATDGPWLGIVRGAVHERPERARRRGLPAGVVHQDRRRACRDQPAGRGRSRGIVLGALRLHGGGRTRRDRGPHPRDRRRLARTACRWPPGLAHGPDGCASGQRPGARTARRSDRGSVNRSGCSRRCSPGRPGTRRSRGG